MADRSKLMRDFHEKMVEVAKGERAAGRNPVRFERMLAELGGCETAKKLLRPRHTAHQGFSALRQRQRADLTVEYWVLQSPWSELFTEDELAAAKRRLTEFGSGAPGPKA